MSKIKSEGHTCKNQMMPVVALMCAIVMLCIGCAPVGSTATAPVGTAVPSSTTAPSSTQPTSVPLVTNPAENLPQGVHQLPDVSNALEGTRDEQYNELYNMHSHHYDDDFDEYIDYFLSHLMQSDYKAVAAILRGTDIEPYRFIEDVDFGSYEIMQQTSDSDRATGYVVKLNVTGKRTNSEIFPVGDSFWHLGMQRGEFSGIFLFARCGENDEPVLTATARNRDEHFLFCSNFSLNLGIYSSCDDFSTMLKDRLTWDNHLHYLLHYYDVCFSTRFDPVCRYLLGVHYAHPGGASAVAAFMDNLAGVTGVDFSNYRKNAGDYFAYDDQTDSIPNCDHGGYWVYSSPMQTVYDESEGVFITTINYYADLSRFLIARSVQYTYRENPDGTFTMISTQLTYDSGAKIAYGRI